MREEGGGRIEELAVEAGKAGARRKLLSLSQDPPVRYLSAHPALLFWGLGCQCVAGLVLIIMLDLINWMTLKMRRNDIVEVTCILLPRSAWIAAMNGVSDYM
jgi:hypothetical protein